MKFIRHEVLAPGIEVYQADCMDIIPHLSGIDACVCDPPYGIDYGKAGGFKASHGWGAWRENVAWDKERPSPEVFSAIRGVSRDQIIWGGNYFADLLPPTMQWLIWDKGQRGFSLADFEMAWSSQHKAARIFQYGRGNEKGFAPKSKEKQEFLSAHPTQKPVEVMSWCLGFLPDAETILDPFMGSGTTGVACVQLGRKFIGIELEPKYFDISCRRISDELKRPRLSLGEPPPAPKQEALF